jgi:hypothetical protein
MTGTSKKPSKKASKKVPKKSSKPTVKKAAARKQEQAKPAPVVAQKVETPFAYLELRLLESVTEDSLPRLFAAVKDAILSSGSDKVLVDMRQASIALTISDLLGLVKMTVASFAGVIQCFAMVLRPADILAEKFFEPAVTNRGLPALVTTEYEDAIYWLGKKHSPLR